MTIDQAKQKLVSWAKAQIGCREGENNWNKYAVGKTGAYGWDVQNQPWCDVFVDAGFIECFGLEAARKMTYQPVFSALCSASAQNYKNNNAWYNSPEVGDQIFLYYNGAINHTGIVVAIAGGLVYSVEGNSSDAVRMTLRGINRVDIAGYGRPDWSVVVNEQSSTQPVVPVGNSNDQVPSSHAKVNKTCDIPMLKYGDKGEVVKAAQYLLIANGFDCGELGADGKFGRDTLEDVKSFQRVNGLDQDGIIGPATWAALLGVK